MNEEWVAIGSSIYSTVVRVKSNKEFRTGDNFEYRDAIAFNVGDRIAKHIVELHNASLKK